MIQYNRRLGIYMFRIKYISTNTIEDVCINVATNINTKKGKNLSLITYLKDNKQNAIAKPCLIPSKSRSINIPTKYIKRAGNK